MFRLLPSYVGMICFVDIAFIVEGTAYDRDDVAILLKFIEKLY